MHWLILLLAAAAGMGPQVGGYPGGGAGGGF